MHKTLKVFYLLSIVLISTAGNTQASAPKGFESIKLPTLKDPGKSFSVSDFKGKVVLLDFWASWCAPCRKSFPFYNELYNKYKNQGFIVIAVNTDAEISKAERFLKNIPTEINFMLLRDAEGKLSGLMNLPTMPTSFLIDRQGNVKYTHAGFRPGDEDKIENMIKQTLGQ